MGVWPSQLLGATRQWRRRPPKWVDTNGIKIGIRRHGCSARPRWAVRALADHPRNEPREANNYADVSVVKIFFRPGVDIAAANAQVTAATEVALRPMPAGIAPPAILKYNAATVRIRQLALSGQRLSEINLLTSG